MAHILLPLPLGGHPCFEVVYTSAKAPTYPLLVDSSLLGAGAAVTNAVIE